MGVKNFLLRELGDSERNKVFTKVTELFPEDRRFLFSESQVNKLIEAYKARVFIVGDITSSFSTQVIVNSLPDFSRKIDFGGEGKIILGNLKYIPENYDTFFAMISCLLKEQLKHYTRLYIEPDAQNNNFIDILRKLGFVEISNLGDIDKALAKFLLNYSKGSIKKGDDETAYSRRSKELVDISFRKRLFFIDR